MKKIPIATCFVIPLEDERYGFGYVVYADSFVSVNIFDYISKNPSDIKLSFNKPLLMRDFMTDWMVFSKSKLDKFPKWILKRNVIMPKPLPPKDPFVILGGGNCLNFLTREQHLATDLEKNEFPPFRIYHKNYYTVYVRAMFDGINVKSMDYDDDKKCWIAS